MINDSHRLSRLFVSANGWLNLRKTFRKLDAISQDTKACCAQNTIVIKVFNNIFTLLGAVSLGFHNDSRKVFYSRFFKIQFVSLFKFLPHALTLLMEFSSFTFLSLSFFVSRVLFMLMQHAIFLFYFIIRSEHLLLLRLTEIK